MCSCGGAPTEWTFARDTTLFLSLVVLLLLFGVAGFAARTYHSEEGKLAGRWFARGQSAMSAGRTEEAIRDFRTAIAYARENGGDAGEQYELALAQALIQVGHLNQARDFLMSLLAQSPADPAILAVIAELPAIPGAPGAVPPQ
jgi:outer membrane protein assembly factor BamD (BamD/ComL family)